MKKLVHLQKNKVLGRPQIDLSGFWHNRIPRPSVSSDLRRGNRLDQQQKKRIPDRSQTEIPEASFFLGW
jgi:hypothetical protein